jgi:chitobiase/beta-hexosaminidase-like protein
MSFQGIVGRGAALAVLGLAVSSCGGSGKSQPAAPTPTFSEGSGNYVGPQSITITDTSTSATIYYTIDGTTPTTSSTKYVTGTPVQISSSLTLEAIAVVSGDSNSAVASAAYVVAPSALPTAGIWVGTDSVSGDEVVALINAAGEATFIRSDYSQYTGMLTVAQATISGTLKGYPNFPDTFADGSIGGSGALNATVVQTTSITGSLAFLSSAMTSYPADYTLGYADVSAVGSSMANVAGSYSDGSTTGPNAGATITITATVTAGVTSTTAGVLASSGASTGCVLSGTIMTADTTTDIYEVAYSYTGCTGTFAPLNGLAMTGLAGLNNGPIQLLMAVNGPAGGGTVYGLVSSLILN